MRDIIKYIKLLLIKTLWMIKFIKIWILYEKSIRLWKFRKELKVLQLRLQKLLKKHLYRKT